MTFQSSGNHEIPYFAYILYSSLNDEPIPGQEKSVIKPSHRSTFVMNISHFLKFGEL